MEITWQAVAIAAVNVLQVVLLAWLNKRQSVMAENINGHLTALTESKTIGRPKPPLQ